MRNLKKILALVLALMMVLSVMVTASAASPLEKFSDVEDVNPDYLEAVTVMVAAGVLNGTDKGLEPERILTRAEAAVLITYLNTTAEGDTADYSGKCETYFDDVTATHWASGFITYCNDKGLMVGTGNGFEPGRNLTYIEYAAMLLRVLGIDTAAADSTKWDVPVKNGASKAKLMTGIESYVWTDEVTREAACQMTFNALNYRATGETTGAYLIVPAETGLTESQEDLIDEINKTPFTSMADAVVYMTALKMDLGTHYSIIPQVSASGTLMASFDELVKPATAADEFGRPLTNVWKNGDGDIIYSEEVTPVKAYTYAVEAKDVAADLKGYKVGTVKAESDTTVENTSVSYNENGTHYSSMNFNGKTVSEKLASLSANGRVLEIYDVNNDKVIDCVTVILYTVDQEIDVTADATTGNVTYTIGSTPYYDYTDEFIADEENNVTGDTVKVYGDVKNGDVVTYVVIGTTAHIYATTTEEGILSRKTSNGRYLTIGTEKIAVGGASGAVAYDDYVIKADAQKFAVDQYGYVVGLADYVAPETPVVSTDYVYVLKAQTQAYVKEELGDATGDLIGDPYGEGTEGKDPKAVANVIFPDGSNLVINLTITNKGTAAAPDYRADLPAKSGKINNDAKLDSFSGVYVKGYEIGNWFAYEVQEDGTYTLTQVDESVAQIHNGLSLTEKQVKTFTVGEGDDAVTLYTNSATVVTGIKLNNTTNAYEAASKTGLIDAALTGKVLVTYAEGASTVSGIYAIGADLSAAPVTPDATYAYVVAAGDQVINGLEYTVYINGKTETIVVNNGKDSNVLTKGHVYELTANTATALVGTYATKHTLDVTSSAATKVTLTDATYFVAGSTYYYAEECVIVNVTTGNTGTADVVEAGDYVVVVADSDDVVSVIYIVDAPAQN